MDETWTGICIFSIAILIVLILLFCLHFIAYKYDVKIAEANIVNVYRCDELIYRGKRAFIKIDSGGMTTTVTIYKKLFPLPITERTYSDMNIRMEASQ